MLQGSILQQLTTTQKKANRSLNLGVYYKNTLIALCHALEDFILETESKPIAIAAFQQGKWYLQEADRYGDIAEKASDIVILATPDSHWADHPTSQKENISLVDLSPNDPISQEWHLIILSPTYTAMVLCQELSDSDYGETGIPENDLERKFYGFWTFEPELVRETVELTIAQIGEYDRDLQQYLSDRVKTMTAEFGHCQRDDLNAIVAKVIDYLHAIHHDCATPEARSLDENVTSNEVQAYLRMAQLIDRADATNPNAAAEVASLAEAMGQLLDLPAWQIKRLRLAGWLHRLAPLQGATQVSDPQSKAQEEMLQKQGLLPKASILRIMPQLNAIARIITYKSEHWDGSGQPEGLSYDDIPLESRILALIAHFQCCIVRYREEGRENPLGDALSNCQAKAGQIFDPKLVEALGLLAMGMQQGMTLQASQPKISTGIWLLDELENRQQQPITNNLITKTNEH
ncbi:DICT sensory domain-containing protein [Spirulina sp. 06S082]|uniref:DICT sensory domain-containing protein n=1 Tax=Spirulina sp. 06S082 TaxID=3110248 RepID=UPI002B1FD83D|nr:DICT sensory domain-containing protein [Spirulina sp. 06S082]MEA5469112.1 DICT sensory domain-containing protein [Spirulina sp. 06S082]